MEFQIRLTNLDVINIVNTGQLWQNIYKALKIQLDISSCNPLAPLSHLDSDEIDCIRYLKLNLNKYPVQYICEHFSKQNLLFEFIKKSNYCKEFYSFMNFIS